MNKIRCYCIKKKPGKKKEAEERKENKTEPTKEM